LLVNHTVNAPDLLEILQRLETELHRLETRRNPARLAKLLHPDFEEFGRSGRVYSRSEVLAEFSGITEFPQVVARNFKLYTMGEEAALLTYTSAHASGNGDLHRHSLRASLWIRGAQGWQMRFHQGTPSDG